MAVTYVTGAKSPTGWGTTNAVPAVASAAGDVLLAFCGNSDSGSGDSTVSRVTTPDADWTRIGMTAVATFGTRMEIFAKLATGPQPAQTWTWASEHWNATIVVAYRGAELPSIALMGTAVVQQLTLPSEQAPAGAIKVVGGWSAQNPAEFYSATVRISESVAPRSFIVADVLSYAPAMHTPDYTYSNMAAGVVTLPALPEPASRTFIKDGDGFKPVILRKM